MVVNNIKYFKASEFIDSKIVYGFFSRNGGLSKKPYDSLNCCLSSGDIKETVNQNINKVLKELNFQNIKLKFINQVHGINIERINNKNVNKKITADGIITQNKNIALGILTADCAPIFLIDINNHLICALHSGWRGCLNNIIVSAVEKICTIIESTNNIIAIIGPCLNKNYFEVDGNFKKKFLKKNIKYDVFFNQDNFSKKIYFDMRSLIEFQLKEISIDKIYHISKDTYKEKSLFFSHRRATHTDSLPTGRMINIIGFKE